MASEDEARRAHLRPVPDPSLGGPEATARDLDTEPEGTPGLTPPSGKVRSGSFVTDVIAELGFVSRERVDQAVTEARAAGGSPERLLVEQGALNADQLSRAIAERYGLDHIDLNSYHVDMGAANLLSDALARRYKAVPVGYVSDDVLLLAMSDPTNVLALDDVQMMTGLSCKMAIAAEEDIEALIGRLDTLHSAVSEAIGEDEEEEAQVSDLRESADDAPVIKLVYSILGQAVQDGASDIHFEPEEREMRVRFRVDGILHAAATVPRRMVAGVVSRIKIMSDLDIAEKRIPQDGRVSVNVDERKVDLRVTTLPTQRGEGVTVRILDKSQALMTLDELGMTGDARERFESSFRQAYGAILVTGPTGSGKSTTLYAALNDLNHVEKNIITIEDPVEYQLPGINQINVHRRAGLDFATGLRSVLRADPDIIMVGEIRDAETARSAVESALTGHMLLTTLHTNSAPGAVTRLQKMGIESFLTASAVDCVVAQRLARKLCSACKKRTMIPAKALTDAGFRAGADVEAYEAVGCGRCNTSGYKGRVGLFSVMVMSEQLRNLTVEGAPESAITEVARAEGMLTLREDGFAKVREGLTSIEEVTRVSV